MSDDPYGRAGGHGQHSQLEPPTGGPPPPVDPRRTGPVLGAPPPPPPPPPVGHGRPWGDQQQAPHGHVGGGDPRNGGQRPPDRREVRATAKAERARAKAMRPWYAKKRWWVVGGVAVLIAVAAVSSSGEDDSTAGGDGPVAVAPDDDEDGTNQDGDDQDGTEDAGSEASGDQASGDEASGEPTAGGQDVYAVGQTAHTGDFDVTLHQVQDPFLPTNQFETPPPGQRLVAVEVEVRNVGDERQTMSTLLGAEVTDSQNRPWTIALAGMDLPQLDGEVGPGEARRGWIMFGVGEDATGLRLRLKGNLTAVGSLFELG